MRRFFSQVWLKAKSQQGGFDLAEFLAFRVGLSISTLILYVLIAYNATGEIDLTRWVVGNAFALCVYECIFGIGGSFDDERFYGRLRFIVVSPTSKFTVIMYSAFYAICMAFVTIFAAFVAGGLIFGVQFSELNLWMFLLAILSTAFTCVGFGMIFAVCALITDSIYLMLNVIAGLVMIFSGANFPVSQLPGFARWIAQAFPLYRSVQAANMSFEGSLSSEFASLLIGEIILGVVFYLAAFALIKMVERIAIRKATLDMF